MQKLTIVLAILLLHAVAIASEDTVIKMSEAVKTGNIVLKPGVEYVVDLTGHAIPKDANLIALQIFGSQTLHYYYQEIRPEKFVYTISSNTMKPAADAPPFSGFKNNDDAFLIIGSAVQPGSINEGVLYDNEPIVVIVRD